MIVIVFGFSPFLYLEDSDDVSVLSKKKKSESREKGSSSKKQIGKFIRNPKKVEEEKTFEDLKETMKKKKTMESFPSVERRPRLEKPKVESENKSSPTKPPVEKSSEKQEDEEPTFSNLSFTIETDDNTITVFPNLALVPYMKLACVIVVKGAPTPKQGTMMKKITLTGQTVMTEKGKNRLVLKTNDIHTVNSVICMGFNEEENTYYGPTEMNIFVKPPPSPEIEARPIEVTPISIEVYVKANMECRVWCQQSDSSTTLNVNDLKQTQYRYVRERSSFYFNDLIPQKEYSIWCYAETKNGIGMTSSLEAKRFNVTTKESTVSFSIHH